MKLIKLLAGLVGVFVLVFIIAGILIPSEQSFTQDTEILASPETVWTVLRDVKSYPEWQDQIAGVEIKDENNWTEHVDGVGPIEFKVVRSEKPKTMELNYANPSGVNGEWLAQIKSLSDQKTVITTTDKSAVKSWVAKIFMSMFFDFEEFAKDWNQKLKKRAESVELKRKQSGDNKK